MCVVEYISCEKVVVMVSGLMMSSVRLHVDNDAVKINEKDIEEVDIDI